MSTEVPRRKSSVASVRADAASDGDLPVIASSAALASSSTSTGGDAGRAAFERWTAARIAWLTPPDPSAGPSGTIGKTWTEEKGTRKLTAAERRLQDEVVEELVRDFDKSTEGGLKGGNLAVRRNALLKLSKQLTDGKRLAKPLQLQHATAILYRGWLHDGTIPPDHLPPTGFAKDLLPDHDHLTDADEPEFRVPGLTLPAGSANGINSRQIPTFEEVEEDEAIEEDETDEATKGDSG